VYPVRPTQCRTFPFWREHVRSRAAWDRLADECPGCNQGRRFTPEEIDARAAASGTLGAWQERLYRSLRELYEAADREVRRAGGTCQGSGRCCDLAHRRGRRHATTLEVDFLLEGRPWDPTPLADGHCPFFRAGRCVAYEVRPLACRVFSCAPGYQGATQSKLLRRYRRHLHRLGPTFGVEIETGELRALLRARTSATASRARRG
jgi:Fe-S-cluster containining protein